MHSDNWSGIGKTAVKNTHQYFLPQPRGYAYGHLVVGKLIYLVDETCRTVFLEIFTTSCCAQHRCGEASVSDKCFRTKVGIHLRGKERTADFVERANLVTNIDAIVAPSRQVKYDLNSQFLRNGEVVRA
jgi:hypothetical protein